MSTELTVTMTAALKHLAAWDWRNEPVCWTAGMKVSFRALKARGLVETKNVSHGHYNRRSGHQHYWSELGAWLTPAGRAECVRLFGITPMADSEYLDTRAPETHTHYV